MLSPSLPERAEKATRYLSAHLAGSSEIQFDEYKLAIYRTLIAERAKQSFFFSRSTL